MQNVKKSVKLDSLSGIKSPILQIKVFSRPRYRLYYAFLPSWRASILTRSFSSRYTTFIKRIYKGASIGRIL